MSANHSTRHQLSSKPALNVVTNKVGEHQWITVVNPTNRRMLLQACDNCGVVKSENTVIKPCKEPFGRGLISSSLFAGFSQTA